MSKIKENSYLENFRIYFSCNSQKNSIRHYCFLAAPELHAYIYAQWLIFHAFHSTHSVKKKSEVSSNLQLQILYMFIVYLLYSITETVWILQYFSFLFRSLVFYPYPPSPIENRHPPHLSLSLVAILHICLCVCLFLQAEEGIGIITSWKTMTKIHNQTLIITAAFKEEKIKKRCYVSCNWLIEYRFCRNSRFCFFFMGFLRQILIKSSADVYILKKKKLFTTDQAAVKPRDE